MPETAPSPSFCFPPVARPTTRLLILGSLPGVQSLARQQYYGHPRNHFWPLMAELTGQADLPARPYPERLETLLDAGIGLWDVVAQAVRPGSLDQNLSDIAANPLADFINGLPTLRAIAFNGTTAARIGTRQLRQFAPVVEGRLPLHTLPSTSPANTMAYARKRDAWRRVAHAVLDRASEKADTTAG